MQDSGAYRDVTGEVRAFLKERIELAQCLASRAGRSCRSGPDFAQTPHQTIELLRDVQRFRRFGSPLLLALSRKDFLGAILAKSPFGRDADTLAAIAHIAQVPGNIVRVHDIAAARDAIRTIEALTGRTDVPADYLLLDRIGHEPLT